VLIIAVAAGRDDWLAALRHDQFVQAVGVIGAICDQHLSRQAAHQIAGWRHVVLLARSEHEADRQPERVYDGMDLGAEAATRAPKGLGLSAPLLTRAPAAWPAP